MNAIVNFFGYFLHQQYSFLNVSLILFIVSFIIGGNDLRIGLGVLSLAALSSLFVIIAGFSSASRFNNSNTWIAGGILMFAFCSFLFTDDSFLPVYSTFGNVALCVAVAQSYRRSVSKCLIDSTALILAFIYITYYLGLYWLPFSVPGYSDLVRNTYLGLNPNRVSEFITISVVSFLFIFFKFRRMNRAHMGYISLVFVGLAFIPLIQTGSRKGLVLFCLSLFMFFYLKYRWYQLSRFFALGFGLLALVSFSFLFLPEIETLSSDVVVLERFQGDIFEVEAGIRGDLLYKGIEKGLEKPIFGFGLDAPQDPKFLKAAGLWSRELDRGINTHNGFVNVFLKGGAVFLLLHLLILFIPLKKLWQLITRMRFDIQIRDELILSFVYLLVFVVHIISSGNGELFKPGWLFLGFAVGQIGYVVDRIRPNPLKSSRS